VTTPSFNIQTRVTFTFGTQGKGGTVALDSNGRKAYLFDGTDADLKPEDKIATLYYRGKQDDLHLNLDNRPTPQFTDKTGQDWSNKTLSAMLRQGFQFLDYTSKRAPTIAINDAPDDTILLFHHGVQDALNKPAKPATSVVQSQRKRRSVSLS
jgi:hypothetical protein